VPGARLGFTLTSGEGACSCHDVYGFPEAVQAAVDPRAPTPLRLGLVGPDESASAWLDRWAEDPVQIHRRVALRRADGVEITLVATLASYGEGVPTSLAVESILPIQGGAILRSGVHPRVEVEAAIAFYEGQP
jgi:hypothetical protein